MSVYTLLDVPVFKSLPQTVVPSIDPNNYILLQPINIQQIIDMEPYQNIKQEKDFCSSSFLFILFVFCFLYLLIYGFSFFERKESFSF